LYAGSLAALPAALAPAAASLPPSSSSSSSPLLLLLAFSALRCFFFCRLAWFFFVCFATATWDADAAEPFTTTCLF